MTRNGYAMAQASDMQQKNTQYNHEMKKKDKAYSALQERLNALVTGKAPSSKPTIEMSGTVSVPLFLCVCVCVCVLLLPLLVSCMLSYTLHAPYTICSLMAMLETPSFFFGAKRSAAQCCTTSDKDAG